MVEAKQRRKLYHRIVNQNTIYRFLQKLREVRITLKHVKRSIGNSAL